MIAKVAPKRPRAFCKIIVDGVDVTDRWNPRLMSVTVIDRTGGQADEAHLELDDRYGQIAMPLAIGPSITIELGWPDEGSFAVFESGYIMDIESSGQKRGGRTMTIIATGHDQLRGKSKEPVNWSLSDGVEDVTLGDAMQKAAKIAGINVKIDSKLAQLKRKYFSANAESFLSFGQRMATEVGGDFKISGLNASLTVTGSGVNTDGRELFAVTATAGENLLAWRIRPQVARSQWASTGHEHFDPMKAAWDIVKTPVPGAQGPFAAIADYLSVGPAPDKDVAAQWGQAGGVLSAGSRGTGWVVIDGEPRAKAGAKIMIAGARAGVDGEYTMTEVVHTYIPQTGFTTLADVWKGGDSSSQEIQ